MPAIYFLFDNLPLGLLGGWIPGSGRNGVAAKDRHTRTRTRTTLDFGRRRSVRDRRQQGNQDDHAPTIAGRGFDGLSLQFISNG